MALSKIDVANMVTGAVPVANGGTALTSGFKNGVTAASQWRLTSTFQGDASPIASNLEEADTDGYGTIGSSMTESSGIFTFPSTGYWFIDFRAEFYYNGDSRYSQIYIQTTTDNSSYDTAALSTDSIAQAESDETSAHALASFLFDVTNTSTHKVRFSLVQSDTSGTVNGNSTQNITSMTFIRLGDT